MNDIPYTKATDLLEEYSPDKSDNTGVGESKDRDDALYVLAQTSGWSELKKIINIYIDGLEPKIKDSDTVVSVGYKYLATKTAKAYLQSIIDMVDQTFEAVENDRKKSENTK